MNATDRDFDSFVGFFERHFFAFRRGKAAGVAIQTGIVAGGILLSYFLYRILGVYSGATTAVEVAILGFYGDLGASLLFSTALTISCALLFLPQSMPTQSQIARTLIRLGSAAIISFLIQAIKTTYRKLEVTRQHVCRARDESHHIALMMERLLAIVTHDVRNPLAAISLTAENLLRYEFDSEKRKKFLRQLLLSSMRADQMLQNLLDVAAIRAGRLISLNYEECDLSIALQECAEEMKIRFPSSEIIFIKCRTALPGIWPQAEIVRAIENLVANAVKYGAAHSPITLRISTAENRLCITVHNFGAPIPREECARLFNLFERGSIHGACGGWGVGLFSVKGIVEAQGGSISVNSETGYGTTFKILLPLTGGKNIACSTQRERLSAS